MGILGAKTFIQKLYFGILFSGYIRMYSNITTKLHKSPANQQRQDCKLCRYKNSVHPNGEKVSKGALQVKRANYKAI